MYFYNQLKDIRKQKGFTIREVAHRSGVSAAYISQLENGNRGIPSPDIIQKLSDGLNVSYTELMKAAGYLEAKPSPPSSSEPINLRRFIMNNSIILDGIVLSDEDKEWIGHMLTALFWKKQQNDDTNND